MTISLMVPTHLCALFSTAVTDAHVPFADEKFFALKRRHITNVMVPFALL